LFQGATFRAHFELAIYLWQEWARSGMAQLPAELQEEILRSFDRCLQLHPSNADALKALSFFQSEVRGDKEAALRVLDILAQV
jgi:hypothetical protein